MTKYGKSVVGNSAVNEFADIRVIQLGEDSALRAEAAQDGVRIHAAFHKLDGDLLLEVAIVANAAVNSAHAAFAKKFDDAIRTDARADQPAEPVVALRKRWRLDEVRPYRRCFEQRFHFLPQVPVGSTDLVQKAARSDAGNSSASPSTSFTRLQRT